MESIDPMFVLLSAGLSIIAAQPYAYNVSQAFQLLMRS